jgi:hypothetical protein
MEIKVIAANDSAKFQTEVNKFIGENNRIVQIQFSTAQFGEGNISYTAFITIP